MIQKDKTVVGRLCGPLPRTFAEADTAQNAAEGAGNGDS